MLKRILCLFVLLSASTAWSQDFAEKFFAKVEKDALRDLERGKPMKQIEAAGTLGAKHADKIAPVLAQHLANPDARIRLAAAEKLWELAGQEAAGFDPAKPALLRTLDDPDAEIAMNAAGALATMKVPEQELAFARRRVLSGPPQSPYVGFLAARGLIGLEPSAPLLPFLLAYYVDAVEAEAQGGSDNNLEIAEKALTALVGTGERELIEPLKSALKVTPAATPFLLKSLHSFSPKPDGWTETLVGFTAGGYVQTRERAWDLLGDMTDAKSLALWAPKAATMLAEHPMRKTALSALSSAAGKTTVGLAELASLAVDSGAQQEHRVRAIEIIADAADETDSDGLPAVKKLARQHWQTICTPVFKTQPNNATFKACRDEARYIVRDDQELARMVGEWLQANPDVEIKVHYLETLESMWSKALPAVAVVREHRRHADARVVQAAEAALNRIEPAWRERDARGAAATSTASISASTKPTGAPPSGKGADGASVFEAISKGDLARVKRLVNAGNVNVPVVYAGMQVTPPPPIQVAINYCGIPQAAAGLKAIIEYLISIGGNPDIVSHSGDNVLDMAKYSCPPEIMAVLGR